MAKIKNKNIYPLEEPISIRDYVIGTRDSDGKTRNFEFAGVISMVISVIFGGKIRQWVTVVILEDSDELISPLLIGAESIDVIISSNAILSTAQADIDFDSETGTISNYPVIAGEKHVIFYTQTENI